MIDHRTKWTDLQWSSLMSTRVHFLLLVSFTTKGFTHSLHSLHYPCMSIVTNRKCVVVELVGDSTDSNTPLLMQLSLVHTNAMLYQHLEKSMEKSASSLAPPLPLLLPLSLSPLLDYVCSGTSVSHSKLINSYSSWQREREIEKKRG